MKLSTFGFALRSWSKCVSWSRSASSPKLKPPSYSVSRSHESAISFAEGLISLALIP